MSDLTEKSDKARQTAAEAAADKMLHANPDVMDVRVLTVTHTGQVTQAGAAAHYDYGSYSKYNHDGSRVQSSLVGADGIPMGKKPNQNAADTIAKGLCDKNSGLEMVRILYDAQYIPSLARTLSAPQELGYTDRKTEDNTYVGALDHACAGPLATPSVSKGDGVSGGPVKPRGNTPSPR